MSWHRDAKRLTRWMFLALFLLLLLSIQLSSLFLDLTGFLVVKTSEPPHQMALRKSQARETFCVGWDTNLDDWWTHHPDWTVSAENDTHYCFSYIENEEKAELFRRIYNVQFKSNCTKAITKPMWSSGWGADFLNVQDGLLAAVERNQPVQFGIAEPDKAWHYSGKKDGSVPVCPQKDMSCYFLDISSCPADSDNQLNDWLSTQEDVSILNRNGSWAYEYATRQQTWLRKEVYDYTKSVVSMSTPCTAVHVRRADVVLHDVSSRKYHAIREYVKAAGKNISKNILLLTDDQNAIDEALTKFPKFNWMFMNRTRFRGTEGGWENQIPSNDAKQEVVVIFSTFRLAQQCNTLIFSTSNFADHLGNAMDDPLLIDLDMRNEDIYGEHNTATEKISKSTWKAK